MINKIENGNGECAKETTRPLKKTTAEGHQQVFNVARNSRTQRRPSVQKKSKEFGYIVFRLKLPG